MADTVTEQIVRESPQIEAYRLGLLDLAKQRAEVPVNIPQIQVAGLTADQQQAIQMGKAGIGDYQQFLDSSGNYLNSAASGLAGVPGIAQSYINPALQNSQAQGQQGVSAATGAAGQANSVAGSAAGTANNLSGQGIGSLSNYINPALNGAQGQATTGIANSNNFSNAASNAAASAGNAVGMASGAAGLGTNLAVSGAQAYDPNRVGSFMDPYQKLVTQEALKEIDRQGAIAGNNLDAQAVKAGAFGGARQGIQQTELGRNLQDIKSQRILQDLSNNFNQAQNASINTFQNDQSRLQQAGNTAINAGNLASGTALGASQLNANTNSGLASLAAQNGFNLANLTQSGGLQAGQLTSNAYNTAANTALQGGQLGANTALQAGQNVTNANMGLASLIGSTGLQAGQLAAGSALDASRGIGSLALPSAQIGGLDQAYGQADSSFLYNLGANQQKQTQAELDAARNTTLAQEYEPFQRISFASDIYAKTPSSQQTLSTASTPDASPLSQIIGAGIAGYGAINSFNQANKSSTFGT